MVDPRHQQDPKDLTNETLEVKVTMDHVFSGLPMLAQQSLRSLSSVKGGSH